MFASGKHSVAVCDRCGWKYPYTALTFEPGTGLRVCQNCNDGSYSIVMHPQNYPPAKLGDDVALQYARPDVVLATTGDADWVPSDSVPVTHNGQEE